MNRQAAIRRYRFLFTIQIIGLCVALAEVTPKIVFGPNRFLYLFGSVVGVTIGTVFAFSWFREWKRIEATPEDELNRASYIARPSISRRRPGLQILGWVAVAAGCGVVLLLIRGLVIGHLSDWMLLGDLLFASMAAYLVYIGRRTVSLGKGEPTPEARFGWGRILLGTFLIFSEANARFHLLSTRTVVKPLEYSNSTQAAAGNATAIAMCVGYVCLIVWGIWKGFRQSPTAESAPTPPAPAHTPRRLDSSE